MSEAATEGNIHAFLQRRNRVPCSLPPLTTNYEATAATVALAEDDVLAQLADLTNKHGGSPLAAAQALWGEL